MYQMERNELVTMCENTENRREKKNYTITQKGREFLANWLILPVEKDELRYETLLKLFFGNNTDDAVSISHIDKFEEKIEGQLAVLKAMEISLRHVLSDDPAHLNYLLTVTFGITTYESYLLWCSQARILLKNRSQENEKRKQ